MAARRPSVAVASVRDDLYIKKRSNFCGTGPLRLCAPESLLSARAKPPAGSSWHATPGVPGKGEGTAKPLRGGGGVWLLYR